MYYLCEVMEDGVISFMDAERWGFENKEDLLSKMWQSGIRKDRNNENYYDRSDNTYIIMEVEE